MSEQFEKISNELGPLGVLLTVTTISIVILIVIVCICIYAPVILIIAPLLVLAAWLVWLGFYNE